MDPQPRLHPTTPGPVAARPGAPAPSFAHASEAELSRILDFYGVSWEYEPHAFPLMWNLRGEVVESFTPDFFLPELDLHIELTTLRQKLVRKKNRKLRRMHELYPDVRIKLLYGKDFRALLLKFGRIALADALSGTVGQTTPPRGSEARRGAPGGDPSAAGARGVEGAEGGGTRGVSEPDGGDHASSGNGRPRVGAATPEGTPRSGAGRVRPGSPPPTTRRTSARAGAAPGEPAAIAEDVASGNASARRRSAE